MRKALLRIMCVFLAMVLLSSQTFANTYRLISISSEADVEAAAIFDEAEIYSAFDQVDDLVAYLGNNESATFDDAKAASSDLVENVSSSSLMVLGSSDSSQPPIFSAFVWGCLFNVFGMLVVALTTGLDGSSMKRSFWGCLINSLVTSISYGGYRVAGL